MIWQIALIIFFGLVLYYLRNGAIPLGTQTNQVERIVRLAKIHPGMKIADLGSGDGRLVIAFAKAGAEAYGYEVNPVLFLWSYLKIQKYKNAHIYLQSFWSADLSKYDTIIVFGISHIMARLEVKLQKELKPGSRVISNIFKFPNWQPTHSENGVHVYEKTV
jgi:cyclopropane fatty-acyl-phospholipid synthase-like methyltransferase